MNVDTLSLYHITINTIKNNLHEHINWMDVSNTIRILSSNDLNYEFVNALLVLAGQNYLEFAQRNFTLSHCPYNLMKGFLRFLGLPHYFNETKLHNLIFRHIFSTTVFCFCLKSDCEYGPPFPDIEQNS